MTNGGRKAFLAEYLEEEPGESPRPRDRPASGASQGRDLPQRPEDHQAAPLEERVMR